MMYTNLVKKTHIQLNKIRQFGNTMETSCFIYKLSSGYIKTFEELNSIINYIEQWKKNLNKTFIFDNLVISKIINGRIMYDEFVCITVL